MVFTDHESKFELFDVEKRQVRYFDRINITGWNWGVPMTFSWSSDSQWLAYNKPNMDNMNVVMIYNVLKDESHQVTSGMFMDYLPTFDRKGDFLYFFSQREISQPKYADAGLTFTYQDTAVLHAVPLRKDVSNPFKAKSDEEEPEKGKKDEEKDKDKDGDSGEKPEGNDPNDSDRKEPEKEIGNDESSDSAQKNDEKENEKEDKDKEKLKPVDIDLENMEMRAFRVPIKRGRFAYIGVK